MNTPKRTGADPSIARVAEEAAEAMRGFVNSLSVFEAFNNAVLFVADSHHANSAGAVAVVDAAGRASDRLVFTHTAIRGKRVDLKASALGTMFRDASTSFVPSRMNPSQHVVFGVRPRGLPKNHADSIVLQLAFDTTISGSMPKARDVLDGYADTQKTIETALKHVMRTHAKHRSLSDALLLDVPITPNAYVIKWDVVGSTAAAAANYAELRMYLNEFGLAAHGLTQAAGGHVAALTGDGQNIVLALPDYVDRSDASDVHAFVQRVALPFVHELNRVHETLPRANGRAIRIAHGLGHVEQSHLDETTGPILFELSTQLKRHR